MSATTSAFALSQSEVVLVCKFTNWFSVLAAQLIIKNHPQNFSKALGNVKAFRKEHGALWERLDEYACTTGDECPGRLAQDIAQDQDLHDISKLLLLARRCALTSAFLAHCIAYAYDHPVAHDANRGECAPPGTPIN